jgi:hypothetical protein
MNDRFHELIKAISKTSLSSEYPSETTHTSAVSLSEWRQLVSMTTDEKSVTNTLNESHEQPSDAQD